MDLEKEQLIKELKYILIRALLLDISAYLISVIFIGFTVSMALGLILGTAGLTVNLILINNSIKSIVESRGANAKPGMLTGYAFRLLITGAVIVSAMMIPFVNVIGALIPYFYPKIVYTGEAFLKKGDKTE